MATFPEAAYEALPTPATPRSGEALTSLLDMIKRVPDDEASSQHKARLHQKVTNAAQTYLAKIALLYDRNQFLAKSNNEGKARRAADQGVLRIAKVMTYEDLEKARAERALKDAKKAKKEAKKAEKEAKKAAKEAKNVASAALEAEEAATGKKTRGRKRKSAASGVDVAEPTAKVVRRSETQVAEGEQEVGAPEPKIKAARTSKGPEPPLSTVAHAEDETALEPWRAAVAQTW
ncbi:uncharacterized protein BDZ99DRAFT_491192 [Mytilinidion resinicola]|uniref:Uncharacterized protein n=1 Tax=Mytilinidion resinicola TaxID=574789 RepID=A0A6A6Y6S9_9PEZI|nr:uncharacterized protein BDZ99DRAFT_491192 [Mytilinidion resinicola]KAF2804390.1 hypothetical protein BDZ99DRAFT_491192 [Mytilinidion resinicola]